MLTEEQKKQNAEKYVELTKLAGLESEEFINYLMKIQYFDAPFTTQYNGAYAGGLCEYALKFAHELGILCNAYFPGKYTAEDILKVALLKDIYKAELFESYDKNIKDESGQWVTVTAFKNKEDRPMFGNIGFSSYMLTKQFTNLTDEQVLAICHSNSIDSSIPDIHEIKKEYPLVTLTKMATEATNYF